MRRQNRASDVGTCLNTNPESMCGAAPRPKDGA